MARTSLRASVSALLLTLSFQAPAQGATAAPEDTILILDASGSMWGQIDGVNKIVVAKEVIEGLVRSLPEERRLGLVAYGHRRKGDCSDIETLADVGADRGKLIAAVRTLNPRGKTPLSASVKHAAEALDYTAKKTTVILVSDGKETCDFDPCELGRLLEENGLDFTVHVVGFDVTVEERQGLECLAEETGGRFLAADNAAELHGALVQVAAVAEPQTATPAASMLVLKATILAGGPLIDGKVAWSVTPKAGGAPVFSVADAGVAETEIPSGDYRVEAVWTGWRGGGEKVGAKEITIGPQQVHVVTVPIDLGLPVSLAAAATAREAEPVEVTWSGPDDLGAQIVIAEPDSGPRDKVFFFAAAKARGTYQRAAGTGAKLDSDGDGDFDQDDKATAALATPPIPGPFEIRYVLQRPAVILARRPIELAPRSFALKVPESAPVSTEIDIEWSGSPAAGDTITLVPQGDTRKFDNARYTAVEEGQPARLWTPAEPGAYEVRYVLTSVYNANDDYVRQIKATAPITVTAAEAGLEAPASAVGGSTVAVDWEGPAGWADDRVSIVAPGAEGFNRDSWASLASRAGERLDPVEIRVHAIPGDYEVVYVLNPGNKTLARRPITITRARATVEAPATVVAGEEFEVTYSGDGFKGDRVVLVPVDTPDEKMWGWGGNYGFRALPDGSVGTIPARLTAGKPGEYELRYVTGLQHQVLARARVTVAG